MIKDSNTYTVSIKNIDSLEKSLASIGLVKQTMPLFLEQVNDISACPCHYNISSSEGTRESVQVIIAMNLHVHDKRGGVTYLG